MNNVNYKNGLASAYERVLVNAEKRKQRIQAAYTPLPLYAAVYGKAISTVPRPTERLAMILWFTGELPSLAFSTGYAHDTGRGQFVAASFAGTIEEPAVVRRGEVKPVRSRICKKCGQEKPLDREHWHRNGSSHLGYNTVCKACRLKGMR